MEEELGLENPGELRGGRGEASVLEAGYHRLCRKQQ